LTVAAGEVYWAIVPYTPQAPFQVYVKDAPPIEIPSAGQIVDGLRKGGDAELSFVVRAKARPILLLSDRSDPRTGDLFGLRLLRLGELSPDERQDVRDQREPQLFPLRPERFSGLSEESAAMVTAPIRVHQTALDTREILGRLDRNDLRTLTERFVDYWQFDLRRVLVAKLRELQRQRR
jgi:hypothetical protein